MTRGRSPDGPNLVLVVADTTRADTFASGSPEATALRDAAIRNARIYERATSPSPWTAPAHASMFSGLAPSEHGVWRPALFLADGRPRSKVVGGELAERWLPVRLAAHGYQTLAISANPWVAPFFGFDRGFERFVSLKAWGPRWADRSLAARLSRRLPKSVAAYARRRRLSGRLAELGPDAGAMRSLETITDWLGQRKGRYFAFLNFMEPHWPYRPPAGFEGYSASERRHAVDMLARLGQFKMFAIRAFLQQETLPSRDLEMLRRLYAGEVSYLQRRLYELIERIDAASGLEETVVVVLSDHGELLGEHGLFGHGCSLHEQLLNVPMLSFGPEDLVGRGVEPRRVSTQAMHGAFLDWARCEPVSLIDEAPVLAEAEGMWHQPVVQRMHLDASLEAKLKATSWAVYEGPWKYVRDETGRETLYDLGEDPAEARDVGDAGPLDTMRRLMAETLARRRPSLFDGSVGDVGDLDGSVEAELRALGYM